MQTKQIAVSPRDVVAGLDRIRDAIVAIETDLSNLEDKARQLESRWSGEAREAYRLAQTAWTRDLAHMVQLLTKLTSIAYTTTDSFTKVESQNAAAWR